MNLETQANLEYLKRNLLDTFFKTAVARREYWISKGETAKAEAVQAEIDAVEAYTNCLNEVLKEADKQNNEDFWRGYNNGKKQAQMEAKKKYETPRPPFNTPHEKEAYRYQKVQETLALFK